MSVTPIEASAIFPFWNSLTEVEKILAAKSTKSLLYKSKSNLYGSVNECLGMICVKKGSLCVYILSDEGREITLQRLHSGDISFLTADDVIEELSFDLRIDAETNSEIYLLPSSVLIRLMEENAKVEKFVYKNIAATFSSVTLNLQHILFQGFQSRLAEFLYNEISVSGSQTVKMTHEQIAKHTGSAREVVSRTLGSFKQKGIVKLSRGSIVVIEKDKLLELF